MAKSALAELVESPRNYDKDIVRKHILSLRGTENIVKANIPEIIFYLGNDFNFIATQLLKLFSATEAHTLLGILLEFYPKFGVLINSSVLGRHFKENKLGFLKWNPKTQTGVRYSGVRDLSSGTKETGEIDVLVDLPSSKSVLALSSKATGVNLSVVGKECVNQNIEWANLEIRSMLTLTKFKKYQNQKNHLSAIVVNKKTLANAVPAYVRDHRGTEFLVDESILQGVVREVFDYVVTNGLTDNASLDNETKPKNHLELWWHQEEFKKACLSWYNAGNTSFLAFHLPRSGKTVSALEIAVETKAKKVLLISAYPHINEQWGSDTINKFSRYSHYQVINLSNKEKLPEAFDKDKHYFVMVSLQDLKMKSKKEREKIKRKLKLLFNTEFDLIIQDEIQQGFETPKTRRLLKQIASKRTLALSATAEKNLWLGSYNKNNTHYWDLNDEKALLEKPAIPEYKKEPYRAMPLIRMLRVKPDMDLFGSFKDFYTPQEGFLFRKLFRIQDGKFVHRESIKSLFWFLLDCQGEMATHFSGLKTNKEGHKNTIRFNPMKLIKDALKSIPEVSLFFVPDTKIQEKLAELLKEEFSDYLAKNNIQVVYTNSKLNSGQKLTQFVSQFDANLDTKYFVILVDQLGVGTTLRRCSAVFFLEDGNSLSAYWQRAMRNRTYDLSGKKPYAFVVDLNAARAFAMEYRRFQAKGYQGLELREKLKEFYGIIPVFDQTQWLNTVSSDEAIESALKHTYEWVSNFENLSGGFNIYRLGKDELGKNALKELLGLNLPGLKVINKLEIQLGEMEKGKESSSKLISSSEESTSKAGIETEEELAWEKLSYLVSCVPTMILCGLIKGVKIKTLEQLAEFFNRKDEEGFSHKNLFNEILTGNAEDKVLTPNQYKEVLKKSLELSIFEATAYQFHEEFPGLNQFDFSSIESEQLKKTVAEVVTPRKLIQDKLDKLPECIWKDPNQVFADICMGTGSYLLYVKEKLMEGLESAFPNAIDRERHILGNMIVGQDILNKNLLITRARINPQGYKDRLSVGDSLSFPSKLKKLNITVGVGNLPFHKNMESGKRSAKNHSAWEQFLLLWTEIIQDYGYLAITLPSSWLSPGWKHRAKLVSKMLVKECQIGTYKNEFKSIGATISWFIAHKVKSKELTKIVTYYNGETYSCEQSLQSLKLIPVVTAEETFSILEKFYNFQGSKFSLQADSSLHAFTKKALLSDVQEGDFIYPVKHTTRQNKWSAVPHRHQKSKKVLGCLSGNLEPEYDDGVVGTTQAYMYSVVKSKGEGENKTLLMKSQLFSYVFSICKWTGFNIEKVFQDLPYPELTDYKDENAVFTALGLNEAEIAHIKKVLK